MLKNRLKKIASVICAGAMLFQASSFVFAEGEESNEKDVIAAYNFDNIADYFSDRFLQSNVEQTLDLEGYVQLALGARKDGANGNTGWYGPGNAGKVDDEHGQSATAYIGQYVSAERGPKLNITAPQELLNGKRIGMIFEYYPVNGTGNTADIILYDETAGVEIATLSVGKQLNESSWNDVEMFVETDGSYMVIVNQKMVADGKMTASKYPQIKFSQVNSAKDQQSKGYIDNMELYTGGTLSDEMFLLLAMNELVIDETQTNISLNKDGESYDVKGDFKLPADPKDINVTWTVEQKSKDSDEWTESNFASILNGTVTVNPTDEIDNYDVRIVANCSYNDADNSKNFNLNLPNPMDEINGILESGYEVVSSTDDSDKYMCKTCGYVYDPVIGDPENGVEAGTLWADVPDSWTCPYHNECDATKESFEETVKDSKIYKCKDCGYTIDLAVGDEQLGIDKDTAWDQVADFTCPGSICGAKKTNFNAVKLSYDLEGGETLKFDLSLPLKNSAYRHTAISWTSSDEEHISIDDKGVAQINTKDLNEHDVTLTAVITYQKGDITYSSDPQVFNIKMGYTEDDVKSDNKFFDKYKVRFDVNCEENFSSIPSSATSDITLPTVGKFGSEISWISNKPSVISNTGKLTQKSSSNDVELTPTVLSGTYSEKMKPISVRVPGKGGNGGGSGSGGTGSSGGGNGNVVVNPNPPSVLPTPKPVPTPTPIPDAYSDLGSVSWAKEAINSMSEKGIINGKTETEFAPNDNITRAEFAKILVGAFGLPTEGASVTTLSDVSADDWFYPYVAVAYENGIITGYDDGTFAPNDNITRQDMAVMVERAMQATSKTVESVNAEQQFTDNDQIAAYAKSAVKTLQTAGIINGMEDGSFAPRANTTRAQAAKVLYNFCK